MIPLLMKTPAFDLSLDELKQNYLKLQRQVHPDKFSQKSLREQALADAQATALNNAYTTLKDPLSRAIYLLSLKNIQIHDTTKSNPEFLLKVMQEWESVEDATTPAELQELNQQNQERITLLLSQLKQAFDNQDYEKFKEWTIELKYWTSLKEFIINRSD
jgi:molecular chaperone HscB